MTDNLENRIEEHKSGRYEGCTKQYNCNRLVYVETLRVFEPAASRELQIKGWTRAKKEALINSVNPDWDELSAEGILRST